MITAHRVLMDAQRVFSGPQWIHSGRGRHCLRKAFVATSRRKEATRHFKECRYVQETEEVHHTTVGGGCCRGRDRRRTDGVRNRSAVLQRERLGNCLPVARQRSDQDFPPPCSAPPPRGHARSDGKGLRAGPRPGVVNGRTSTPTSLPSRPPGPAATGTP